MFLLSLSLFPFSLVLASGRVSCFRIIIVPLSRVESRETESVEGTEQRWLKLGGEARKRREEMTNRRVKERERERERESEGSVSDAGSSSVQLRGLIDVNSKGN